MHARLLFFIFLTLGSLVLIVSMNLWSDKVYGQMVKSPEIKITSPIIGEQVGINKSNVPFTGTSSDNYSSSCQVSVIVNNVKPYQPALPIGDNDYSSWSFILSPAYTQVKEGQNKATAKISCFSTPINLTKWYSVNFTGIVESNITSSNTEQGIQQKENDNTDNANSTKGGILPMNRKLEPNNNNSTNALVEPTSKLVHASPPYVKYFSVSTAVDKNPIVPGDVQTVRIIVSDADSGQPIAHADIKGLVTNPSGKSKEFNVATDMHGEVSHSWKINKKAGPGEITVGLQVASLDYETKELTTHFQVIKIETANPFDDESLFNFHTTNPFS
jgi:hypothetical protein